MKVSGQTLGPDLRSYGDPDGFTIEKGDTEIKMNWIQAQDLGFDISRIGYDFELESKKANKPA